jgi:hypothetical protein
MQQQAPTCKFKKMQQQAPTYKIQEDVDPKDEIDQYVYIAHNLSRRHHHNVEGLGFRV